jgi:nitrile hydratase beta subunit
MDGVHDMGGLQGFGPIETEEPEDPRFHAAWHGRMFAISRALRAALPMGGDHVRRDIERMDPAHYLASSYYEKWFEGNFACLKGLGAVSDAELAGGPLAPLPSALGQPRTLAAERATAFIFGGLPGLKADFQAPRRFAVGQRVRTQAHGIAGHTRLPRYARNCLGTVEALRGAFTLADANAAGRPRTEWCYLVAFSARDLWGEEAAAGDEVTLDLWESYLLPAGDAP